MSISISNIRCFQSVGMILQLPSRRRPGKQFLVCGGMMKECEAKGGRTTNAACSGRTTNAACSGRSSGAGDSNTEVDRVSRAGRWLKGFGMYFDHWTCDRGVVAARQVPPQFTRVFLLSCRLVFSIPSQTSYHASRTRVNPSSSRQKQTTASLSKILLSSRTQADTVIHSTLSHPELCFSNSSGQQTLVCVPWSVKQPTETVLLI